MHKNISKKLLLYFTSFSLHLLLRLNVTFFDLVVRDLDLVFTFVLLFDFEPDIIFLYLR